MSDTQQRELLLQLLNQHTSEPEVLSTLFTRLGVLSEAKKQLAEAQQTLEECLENRPSFVHENEAKSNLSLLLRHIDLTTLINQAPQSIDTERAQLYDWLSQCQQKFNLNTHTSATSLDETLQQLLTGGQKLQAIKLARDVLQIGLKQAKDYVESL